MIYGVQSQLAWASQADARPSAPVPHQVAPQHYPALLLTATATQKGMENVHPAHPGAHLSQAEPPVP